MQEINEIFRLDSETGKIYWVSPSKYHKKVIGKEAGSLQIGGAEKFYWTVTLNNKKIKRSHIVFYMTNGYWPKPCVDHINGDSLDDRPKNLRQATFEQNAWNHKKRKRRIQLPMGVRKITNSGRFQARIVYKKQTYHLGAFDTPHEAQQVYLVKRKEFFGEFA